MPSINVSTAHPLLILSTTYDPICPLVSAKAARRTFHNSRLIEVKGYGHCSIAMPSMCLAKRVRAFLHDGELPDSDIQCEVDAPPFAVAPDERRSVTAYAHFDNPEEQQIHEAQVALAREWGWF